MIIPAFSCELMRGVGERGKYNGSVYEDKTGLQSLKSEMEAALEPGDRDLFSCRSLV